MLLEKLVEKLLRAELAAEAPELQNTRSTHHWRKRDSGCGRHLGKSTALFCQTANQLVIGSKDTLHIKLVQRQQSATNFNHFGHSGILRAQFRGNVAISCMHQLTHERAGLLGALDHTIDVAVFGELVSMSNNFALDFIGLL